MLSGFLAILLAMQSAPAQQRNDRRTWYQAYADAQRNIQQRNWDAAIADIEAASRLGAPKPGRNVLFYGDVYRDFNPDYYLGQAYLNLNRYDDADRAFERVKQAQLIAPRDSLYAEFTRQATSAKEMLEKQAASQRAAADAILNPVAGQNPAGQAASNQQAPVPPPIEQPPIQQPAIQQPPIEPPSIPQQAPVQQGPIQQQPTQQAPVPPAPSPNPAPVNVPARPPVSIPSPPVTAAEERSALVDFFSGAYEAAASKLSALTSKPNASPRAFFYLACSRAALALTGRADAAIAMADARAQLALARDTGQFAADKALISPRIRQALGMQP